MAFRELKELNVKDIRLILLLSVSKKKVTRDTAAQSIRTRYLKKYTSSGTLETNQFSYEVYEFIRYVLELNGLVGL